MTRIKAYFDKMSQARKAVEAVKNIGCKNAYLDMVERMYDEHSIEIGVVSDRQGPHPFSSKKNSAEVEDGVNIQISETAEKSLLIMDSQQPPLSFGTCLLVDMEDEDTSRVKAVIKALGGDLRQNG